MKALIKILILTLPLLAKAQTWCNQGALWHYSFFNPLGSNGYVKIAYTGDTLVGNRLAKKLTKTLHAYAIQSGQFSVSSIGTEYTYEDSGIVFLLFNNHWDTLYNFNANPGEHWGMAKQPLIPACDSNSTLNVLDTGRMVVNTVTLRYQVVEFNYGNGWPQPIIDTLLEKVGFTGRYMLPYNDCNLALDVPEGGPFRCYQDDAFGTFQAQFTGPCDLILGNKTGQSNSMFELLPNPAVDYIDIRNKSAIQHAYFEILNSSGQKVFSGLFGNRIDISTLPSGLYILSFFYNKEKQNLRFMKY